MKTPPKPITIIGGMGPQASSRLYNLLIEHSARHPNHKEGVFPHVILRSVAIEDFISNRSNQKTAQAILEQTALAASRDNPAIVAMACNTAHIFADTISRSCGGPFVSMIELVSRTVEEHSIRQVGLLASPTTIRTKLYTPELAKRDINCLTPPVRDQLTLENAIRAVIAGKPTQAHAQALREIAEGLVRNGAKGLILGCTELPLIFPENFASVPVFDSLDIMASHLIDKYYE